MTKTIKKQLPFWVKFLYGSGDWGISSIGMMRSIFYAIYLTDVVGLEPRLASYGALIGIVWDAGLCHHRRVRRRVDGGTHTGVPGQKDRGI